MITPTTEIFDALGIISIIGSAIVYLRAGTRKVNDTAAAELIANLTRLRETDKEEFNKRLDVLEAQRLDNQKALSRLEGQLAAYKDIPLQTIAASMEKMASVNAVIANSNAKILETLQSSAVLAATDRDVLPNPVNQTIAEQVVEHQTVKS